VSVDGLPYSERFEDVYFSAAGGLDETRHTFLLGNALPERWRGAERFTIVECGFGTGLNFLATWQAWRTSALPDARLQYVAVEKHPLTHEDLVRTLSAWLELSNLARELVRVYPPPVPGFHRLHFDHDRVVLTLLFGDAAAMLAQIDAAADAFFLDGFAPARNPEMWSATLFRELVRLAAPGATLATYTVAGGVRRALAAAGFRVEKRAGYGCKRQMLVGALAKTGRRTRSESGRRHAAVVGAGLAGTACAERLAARGWTVDLIERHPAPAGEASGNPAGIFHPGLLADRRVRGAFTAAAALYGSRELERLTRGELPVFWKQSGVLQVCRDPRRLGRLVRAAADLGLPEAVARRVDRDQGCALSGAKVGSGGFWFERGGWASAASICEARVAAGGDRVRPMFQREALQLAQTEGGWRVLDLDGQTLSEAPIIVLANAAEAARFEVAAKLPLRRVRGQVTQLPAQGGVTQSAPLCGDGYVTPARDGFHYIGATFDEDDQEPAVRSEDNASNLALLRRLLPDCAFAGDPATLGGWVGFRAMSPDRLPLIGPLPDAPGPGLFACLALGARGLTVSALAAELLTSMVTGDALPVERQVADQFAPGRFQVDERAS
jgi:tRNA 5-methylaminomethyl-2-thiouridine biosynthesis bifunctional protein